VRLGGGRGGDADVAVVVVGWVGSIVAVAVDDTSTGINTTSS
jgi:hypothetical protein